MYRMCLLRNGAALSLLPIDFSSKDVVSGETATEKLVTDKSLSDETGWDRLVQIFKKNEFGGLSPEVQSIGQMFATSMFAGAIYGGFIYSRVAYMDFIKNNQATSFTSHLDAKRQLQDKIMLAFGKGAFRWGWRLSLFCTSFIGIYTAIQTYRGKYGILEYIVAGVTTGALYKFNMGPQGWLVGGGVGLVLGAVAGGLTNLLLSMTGMTMDDARYWQSAFMNKRNAHFHEAAKEFRDKEQSELFVERTKLFKDKNDLEGLESENLNK